MHELRNKLLLLCRKIPPPYIPPPPDVDGIKAAAAAARDQLRRETQGEDSEGGSPELMKDDSDWEDSDDEREAIDALSSGALARLESLFAGF